MKTLTTHTPPPRDWTNHMRYRSTSETAMERAQAAWHVKRDDWQNNVCDRVLLIAAGGLLGAALMLVGV